MKKFALAGLFIFLFTPGNYAQLESTLPLRGKTIAVYFSKKNFTYDDHYLIPLSQFVKTDKAIAPTSEDLKLLALVSLGRLFSAELANAVHADSAFFLNEDPDLGGYFVTKYRPENHFLPPLDSTFKNVDYIMVVNPLTLGSYKSSQVYSRSNKIIAEQVIMKSGKLRLDIYDPVTGYLVGIFEGCYAENDIDAPAPLFNFHSADSPLGKYLSLLFSSAVNNLNTGIKSNCETK